MFIKRFATLRKSIINNIPLLPALRNKILINRTKKQFEEVDFEVKKQKGSYTIIFNDKLGYNINYLNSSFYFDKNKQAYCVTINGACFYTYTFPVPEIIREIRGYLLMGLPPQNKHIIDIGASNGFISMALASLVSEKACVYALEPDRSYIDMLKENIAQNHFRNIRIIQKGIYKEDGTFSFVSNGDGSSRLVHDKQEGLTTISTQKLDSFLKENNITKESLGFIKMDIEGAEIDIIDDLIEVLKENRECIIAIASYHVVNNKLTSEIIEDICKKHDHIFCITRYPYHPTTFLVHKDSIYSKKHLT